MPLFAPQLTDAEVADARRRVAGDESLREVARSMGVAHTTLSRRFSQADRLADQAAATADRARLDARAATRADPSRPSRAPEAGGSGRSRPLLKEDIEAAAEAERARLRRAALQDAPREQKEISDDEYFTQWIESHDVASGRKTEGEVLAARRAGRRTISARSVREPAPGFSGGYSEQRGVIGGRNRVLLAQAFQ